jgi:hypothetical protein
MAILTILVDTNVFMDIFKLARKVMTQPTAEF